MGKGEGVLTLAAAAGVGALVTKYLDDEYFLLKDAKLLFGLTKLGAMIQHHLYTNWTAADALEEAALAYGEKEAIVFEDVTYSFREWNEKANQVARWALKTGIKKGDVVAIYMENKPEYMFAWTGLAKIGAVGALINNNLKQKPLMHCLEVAECKHVLFGEECFERVEEALPLIEEAGYTLHIQGGECEFAQSVDKAWRSNSKAPIPKSARDGVTYNDPCMYIYTSGTTGLPKAAVVKHAKLHGAGAAFAMNFGITYNDRIYNSGLPLYHSAGNNIGGGVCLQTGATLVLRRKFSASNFWREAAEYKCTVVQYIGELCRYLLAVPPSPADKAHSVRLAIGNGLRPDIWEEFQTRFNIPEIGEFYGATEGNVALFNWCKDERARGAVGHMGILMRQVGLCTILKYDREKEEIVRDPVTGFCIEAADGEPGEACAAIKDRPAGSFDGYKGDEAQTNKKILTNVFKEGDRFFRTGDLLMKDKLGYYYFIDRLGDTFRWKGENVATTEVTGVVSAVPGVIEANIYGVQVPGKDGRACCAAITSDDTLDLDEFLRTCKQQLPSYAVPLFIRILPKIDTTGTFKQQKVGLRNEGIDLDKINDTMYFLDDKTGSYIPYTKEVYVNITTGNARL